MNMRPDLCHLFSCVGLDRKTIRKLAFETGFCKRHSGKINAPDFVIHLCLESISGTVSYNDLAARVEARTGIAASRQAYWERTDEACTRLFQRILERVMLSKCNPRQIQSIKRQGRFKRILLQDSTIIKLPQRLMESFSGVRNAHTIVCNARIQGIYDLMSGHFLHFSIDPYSRNDRAATLDLAVQHGDLVLRDRGYFTFQAIKEHTRAGADSIYRYPHPTILHDSTTGRKIELLQLLNVNDFLDMWVDAGPDQSLHFRLIAFPVPEEMANLRRMKAKKAVKGHKPSREILKLMSWSIFLTTIADPSITANEIAAFYGLRWRIENIFKTWKSYFNFQKVHNVPEIQLRVLLKARLIMITLAYERLFLPLLHKLRKTNSQPLSLIKFMRYITRNLNLLSIRFNPKSPPPRLCSALQRYCSYDKRSRTNFITEMEAVVLSTA
jgi:hypothetical protein